MKKLAAIYLLHSCVVIIEFGNKYMPTLIRIENLFSDYFDASYKESIESLAL